MSDDVIKDLQKAIQDAKETEVKPIDYRQCADAMLMMWIANVLTDGEYNRIMDKLNKAHTDGVI